MHRPRSTPANAIEIIAVYRGEKSHTRRDKWAVHRAEVVDCPINDPRFPVGVEIEVSGNSEPVEWDESGFGVAREAELRIGCEYRFHGLPTINEFRGKKTPTLKFTSFNRCEPQTKEAILRYLQEAPHVGPKIAATLYQAFGGDAVRVLRNTPAEAVAGIAKLNRANQRLSLPHAEAAAVHLRSMAALESTTMEMMKLLGGYGLPKSTAKKAIQKWGSRAAEVIKKNPLGTLMSFRGCGFLKADKVYQSLGLPLDALKRMTLCAYHHLSSDANGHTWHRRSAALTAIRQSVGGASTAKRTPLPPQAGPSAHWSERPYVKHLVGAEDALRIGIKSGLLAEYVDENGEVWLAEGEKAREEQRLAEVILAAMDEPNPWEPVLASEELPAALAPLSDHQREALLRLLHGGAISILGGGPGVGKTFTAAALMRLLVKLFGEGQIAATAFTGKAARRFTEGMAAYQIPVTAVTTHSLLKVKNWTGGSDDGDDDDSQSEFEYNRANPLNCRLIVVDEVSMDDVPLLLAILEARPKGCGVLLVGDVNQLPPIGHGAPLRDLIAAGIPYGELTKVRRNSGRVVKVCKRLAKKSPVKERHFVPFDKFDPEHRKGRNLSFVRATDSQATNARMIEVLKSVRDRFGFNQVWDCQVIVATNKKRVELNNILQRELNPTADVVPNCRFRVGDKAIQLKNMSYKLVDSTFQEIEGSSARVANGEFAKVLAIQEKKIIAEFSTPTRRVSIPRVHEKQTGLREEGKPEPADGESQEKVSLAFDLGLAATCHKMQGSQAKCVIVVLESAYGQACEWFLTAISRMEKACVCVGDFTVIQKMVGKRSLGDRKTFLKEEIEAGRLFGERVWWESNIVTFEKATEAEYVLPQF